MKFNFKKWDDDGRPATKAFGSNATELGRHLEFPEENYFRLDNFYCRDTDDRNLFWVFIKGGGHFYIDKKYA